MQINGYHLGFYTNVGVMQKQNTYKVNNKILSELNLSSSEVNVVGRLELNKKL